MKNLSEKHQFSFHWAELPLIKQAKQLYLNEPTLVHRLYTIMRYQVGDTCILFNSQFHTTATLTACSKKGLEIECQTTIINKTLNPEIVLFLPLLKKESLEQAVYNAVVAGVTHIQLIITHKCHKKSITPSDFQRLEKIVIAACEQSKYYSVPSLKQPVELNQALEVYKDYSLYYADFTGTSLSCLTKKSIIMVGPEGDLTYEEKEQLKSYNAHFFLLTPTVLRSQEAVLVALAHARMI